MPEPRKRGLDERSRCSKRDSRGVVDQQVGTTADTYLNLPGPRKYVAATRNNKSANHVNSQIDCDDPKPTPDSGTAGFAPLGEEAEDHGAREMY